MSLPPFNSNGDLPEGIHQATLSEIGQRFGFINHRRRDIHARLGQIHELAISTGYLGRFIIFGSFVTAKDNPNDVDIILVMRDDFEVSACFGEMRKLFYHDNAQSEFGASIFWIRPSMLVLDTLEEFIRHWQIKRDLGRRGIVEVIE